jgi:hypothetical protein
MTSFSVILEQPNRFANGIAFAQFESHNVTNLKLPFHPEFMLVGALRQTINEKCCLVLFRVWFDVVWIQFFPNYRGS